MYIPHAVVRGGYLAALYITHHAHQHHSVRRTLITESIRIQDMGMRDWLLRKIHCVDRVVDVKVMAADCSYTTSP
jgi:hypothetical protein